MPVEASLPRAPGAMAPSLLAIGELPAGTSERTDGDLLKVESAMKFMRAHAARPLSVQQIARHVGMSESHFAHRFRDVARVSPMRYLRHVRLAEARSLMLAEGSRPSEVAGRVGFESASHFTREFKRFYGASPGEYVRRFRE